MRYQPNANETINYQSLKLQADMIAAKEARMKPIKFVKDVSLKALYTVSFDFITIPLTFVDILSGALSFNVLRSLWICLPETKDITANPKNKTASTAHNMKFMLELYQHHIKKTNLVRLVKI